MRAVVVKSAQASGLGDLIKSALNGVAYSIVSRRNLYIDWSGNIYNYGFGKNLFYDLFELKGVPQLYHLPIEQVDVYPLSWLNSLDKSFTQLWVDHGELPWNRAEAIQKYSFDLSRLDYPQSVLVMWDFDQFSHLRQHVLDYGLRAAPDYKVLAALFSRHVRLKDALQQRIDKEWARISCGQSVLGVHIRLTRESIQARSRLSTSAYIKAIRRTMARTGISRIFLATDNKQAQGDIISEFGENVFVIEKWLATPGEALHLNNTDCPDAWENVCGALTDIFLLARCSKFICQTNSSFAQVAFIAGDMSGSNIIDAASTRKTSTARRALSAAKRIVGQHLRAASGLAPRT
jgi:Nodulation protein Z (NodZ)